MYTCKGTTIYRDGVEISYIRTYIGTQEEKYQFVKLITRGLNHVELAEGLAKPLTDLVGLVKAPDKNLQFYASQVRSTLYDAEKALFDYAAILELEVDRRELDMVTLSEADTGFSADIFDKSLAQNGLVQTLTMEPEVLQLAGEPFQRGNLPDSIDGCVGEDPQLDRLSPPEGWGVAETSVDDMPDPLTTVLPAVTRAERDAILAGLRMLQMAVEGTIDLNRVGGDIMDIATESGRGLSVDEISALCERLNIWG
jgi:hypothetical protein